MKEIKEYCSDHMSALRFQDEIRTDVETGSNSLHIEWKMFVVGLEQYNILKTPFVKAPFTILQLNEDPLNLVPLVSSQIYNCISPDKGY